MTSLSGRRPDSAKRA